MSRAHSGNMFGFLYGPLSRNDANAVVLRRDTGREFPAMIVDQCDKPLEHGGGQPLVTGVALHAHVSGQPFRLRTLRQALRHVQAKGAAVWITDTDRIATTLPELDAELPGPGSRSVE
jgi:allantoinase